MARVDSLVALERERRALRLSAVGRRTAFYLALLIGTLGVWQLVHLIAGRLILPSPMSVALVAQGMLADGTLLDNVFTSYRRAVLGWLVGCALSIPLGLLMARILLIRRIFDPYLNFFRFIPPIAFVTLALIWFGIGEESKIVLIIYTSAFVMVLATMHGALSVDPIKIRAAKSLGASDRQVLLWVVIPATVPHIVTGMRLAMGNGFMTIIGAEMIAAKSGIGFMIWDARAFMETEKIYLGLVSLSLMGFTADYIFRLLMRPISYRFNVRM